VYGGIFKLPWDHRPVSQIPDCGSILSEEFYFTISDAGASTGFESKAFGTWI
jgi:hypothetical protein